MKKTWQDQRRKREELLSPGEVRVDVGCSTIENSILVEKHHGYQYEHCFSRDWNAMRRYRHLVRLGPLGNALAQNTARLAKLALPRGARGMIQFYYARPSALLGWMLSASDTEFASPTNYAWNPRHPPLTHSSEIGTRKSPACREHP